MLTPEAQLMAAYQAAQQQPMMPQIPQTYNTTAEEMGMGITGTGIAVGSSAANFATMAPGFMLPMLMAAPIATRIAGSSIATSAVGRAAMGALSPINTLLNPFGFAKKAFSAAGAAGMGKVGSFGVGAMAAAPGLALALGTGAAINYAATNVFEGAQDYVATRQLMREMPGVGFGSSSILGGGSGLTNLSAGQISQANQSIQSIGGRHGLDASASRNLLSNLSQTGMIDTSSVRTMSQSYQKALSDFKLMAKTLQIDIDQTIELYKGLDQLGLRGNAERKSVLSRASSTASLTGKSFDSVMQTVGGAVSTGNSLGLSSYASANIATRAMAVSALAEKSGAVSESYLNRVGGYDGYTNRMIELELGMSRSSGAMRMMANMYDTGGRFRSDNSISAGMAGRSANSFFRNVDPYELDRMSQEMSSALPSMVLARVDSIQARHGAGSVRANREQHKFMQTMGIEDPQEQLAFLTNARSAGAGQFAQGMQVSADRVNAAPSAAAEALRRESLGLKDALKLMTSSLTTELRAFGEAMQAASEDAASRIAMSRGGQGFSVSNFQSTTQQLGVVSDYIRQGRIDPFTADPMRETMNLEGKYRGLIASGLSSSSAFTGITRAEGQSMLTGRFDRTVARFGYDLPEQIANIVNTTNRAALATVFGEDVFSPLQSGNDVMGGFETTRNNTSGGYRIRSGNDANRGNVSFGQVMESVANMHGQYYDSRTNSILQTNSFGERQFRNQYGDALNNSMNNFRSNVSTGIRNQLGDSLLTQGLGLGGSIAAGAMLGGGAGSFFGVVGAIPGAIAGGVIGGAAYTAAGGLSSSIRATREYLFGDTGGGPRRLGADVQQILSTRQGAAATRNHLATQVFGQSYNSLSQSQKMYFDNYLRTSEDAADFAGVVPEEVARLSEYEMANLGINIAQEGVMRNVFTTTTDHEAAIGRRDMFRNAIAASSGVENNSLAAMEAQLGSGILPELPANFNQMSDSEKLSIRQERGRLLHEARLATRQNLTDADRITMSRVTAAASSQYDVRQEVSNRRALQMQQTTDAIGLMTPEQQVAFQSENYEGRQQMLRNFANQEDVLVNNRIVLEGIDAAEGGDLYRATAGALLAVAQSGGNNNNALDSALLRTTSAADMSLSNLLSGSSDRQSFISDVNQNSREATVALLATQRTDNTDQTAEEFIAQRLIVSGVNPAVARARSVQIMRSGSSAVGTQNSEVMGSIYGAIGAGLSTTSEAVLRGTVTASEELAAAAAQNQYAAAFDEASSQNLNVLRQQRAGDFARSSVGQNINLRGRTGAEIFSEMTVEDIEGMNDSLNTLRGQIANAEVAGTDPENLRRLQQQAAQLEEFINLSGEGDSTNRMARLASGALFVGGEFQGGNVGTVVSTYGFAGAASALNNIAALTDDRTGAREKTAAFNALVGDSPEQQKAFAERLGIDPNSDMDDIRREFNRRASAPGDTFLQDLVQDVLKSTGVEVSDEADAVLQRDAYTAMIGMAENLAASVTAVAGERAIRVLSRAAADEQLTSGD